MCWEADPLPVIYYEDLASSFSEDEVDYCGIPIREWPGESPGPEVKAFKEA